MAREKAARERAASEQAARDEAALAAAAREAAAVAAAAAREPAAREHAIQEASARARISALDGDLAEFVAGIEDAATVEKDAHAEARPAALPPAVEPATQPEWKQLLTAIKRDIEHLRTEHPDASAGPAAPRSSNPPKTGRVRTAARRRARTALPSRTSGAFRSRTCGFAALLTTRRHQRSGRRTIKERARPRH